MFSTLTGDFYDRTRMMLNEAAVKRKPTVAIETQVSNCLSREYRRQFESTGSLCQ